MYEFSGNNQLLDFYPEPDEFLGNDFGLLQADGIPEEEVTEALVTQFIIQSALTAESLESIETSLEDVASGQVTEGALIQSESAKPTEEPPAPEAVGPPEIPPPPNKPPFDAAELPSPGDEPNEPRDEVGLAINSKDPESAKSEAAEEPSATPSFDMSAKEAERLGLTVTEWMRHRWTGEFPDRIEDLNRQTFRDQTASRPFLAPAPEPKTVEPTTQQDSAPTLEPLTFFSHNQWAIGELGWLKDSILNLVNDPNAGLHSEVVSEITARAERLRDVGSSLPEYYDPALAGAEEAYSATVGEILHSDSMPISMKTELVDAMALKYLGQHNQTRMAGLLERELATGTGIELCTNLLGRQTRSGEAAVTALQYVVGREVPPSNMVSIAASVLEPLARRIQQVIEIDSGHLIRPEANLLMTILDKLDASEKSMKQVEALGVNFQELADNVSATLNSKMDEVARGTMFITHSITLKMVEVLHKLYCPQNRPSPEPSDDLRSFLEVIYHVKLERYGSHPDVRDMCERFNQLAKVCGKQLRVKTWPSL